MSDFHETLSNISKIFLELYRSKILSQWKGSASDGDKERFVGLLNKNDFARQLYGLYKTLCFRYENDEWHSIVLDTLDLDLIYNNVDKAVAENNATDIEYQDYLVKELLRYFKQDFFTWCNKPKCIRCGNDSNMEYSGSSGPNSEEAKYECGNVVELYRCNVEGYITRFPRYNDPIKLLETRTGRCGEWCNLFTLILKTFGLEARYIWNKEDHVWCEFYSPNLKRWVHVDSCEQSFDEPHIYSQNWNKKMSYVLAFSHDTVLDVSSRYILKNQLPRDAISESDLNFICVYLTKQLRKRMNDDQLYTLACRDEQERLEWEKSKTKQDESKATTALSGSQGRESGSAEWKAQRGEDGA